MTPAAPRTADRTSSPGGSETLPQPTAAQAARPVMEGIIRMTSTTDSPAEKEWANKIKQLSPGERARRTEAVDILLGEPQGLNDILESELWTLRGFLQGPS